MCVVCVCVCIQSYHIERARCTHGVMVNVMGYRIVLREFELQSR